MFSYLSAVSKFVLKRLDLFHVLIDRTDDHISQFAALGLRTLVLGHKTITQVTVSE